MTPHSALSSPIVLRMVTEQELRSVTSFQSLYIRIERKPIYKSLV